MDIFLFTEIDLCLSNPCSNSSKCVSIVGGYRCLCPYGYTGRNCDVNIDDCVNNTCKNGAACQDEIGRFTCLCPSNVGYEGLFCDGNKLCIMHCFLIYYMHIHIFWVSVIS